MGHIHHPSQTTYWIIFNNDQTVVENYGITEPNQCTDSIFTLTTYSTETEGVKSAEAVNGFEPVRVITIESLPSKTTLSEVTSKEATAGITPNFIKDPVIPDDASYKSTLALTAYPLADTTMDVLAI